MTRRYSTESPCAPTATYTTARSLRAAVVLAALPPLAAACGVATTVVSRTSGPAPACRAHALRATFKVVPASAGAGQIGYLLTVTNVSSRSCWVRGLPVVRLLDAHGGRLPTQVTPEAAGRAAASRLTLAPKASATATARFSPDIPGLGELHPPPCEPVAARLRIAAPGGGTLQARIAPPTSVCSHGALRFRPFTPATHDTT